MIEIVKTINGVKKLVPLTTDSGQGLPLGAWTSFEDDQSRNGYLKAGTTFNQTDYPALYTMLGTNVVPDKGYGLDWDNAEAITLSTSDYVVQKGGWIVGTFITSPTGNALLNGTVIARATNQSTFNYSGQIQVEVKAGDILKTTTTVIEQFMSFVPYLHPMFIKAVIGPIEDNAADQVVQNINNSRSYSTEEVNTGATWIDGKPIYRKVITGWIPYNTNTYNVSSLNIDNMIDIGGFIIQNNGNTLKVPYDTGNGDSMLIYLAASKNLLNTIITGSYSTTEVTVIIEYTKTTD